MLILFQKNKNENYLCDEIVKNILMKYIYYRYNFTMGIASHKAFDARDAV